MKNGIIVYCKICDIDYVTIIYRGKKTEGSPAYHRGTIGAGLLFLCINIMQCGPI